MRNWRATSMGGSRRGRRRRLPWLGCIRDAAPTRTAALRSAFAHVHAHARGTYDLEEAAPRPAEHPLGRAAYRSRSASRVVAAHEVGVATGRSDGTDVSDSDRGRDEEKADERQLLRCSAPPSPPVLDERPYRPSVRRQGSLLGELLPQSPYVCRTSVRPNVLIFE